MREILGEAASRFFADTWYRGLRGFDASNWESAVEMGLPRILLGESDGGAGGDWQNIEPVLIAAGRYASPLPLLESALGMRVLTAAGTEPSDAPLAISIRGAGTLARDGNGWAFSGELAGIALYPLTQLIVGMLEETVEPSAFTLEPSSAHQVIQGRNLAGEPRVRMIFDRAPVQIHPGSGLSRRQLFDQAALLRCAQITGALMATLEQTTEYAGSRKQFGRAIGQFQSVRQALALFSEEVSAVSAACAGAFLAADSGSSGFEVACAKLRANEAIGVCVAIAHQVHGAIGFTQDFHLRHYTQRLLSWRTEFGNDQYWADRLGSRISARGADRFWQDLTARSDALACSSRSQNVEGMQHG